MGKFRITIPGTRQATPGGSHPAVPSFTSSQPGSTAAAVNPTRCCCHVGIDFGTSGTGCMYVFGSDTRQIRVLGNLPGAENSIEAKTATALLYEVQQDGKWIFIEWGEKAMKRYRFSNAADQAKWRLLEGKQFKLALANYGTSHKMGFPKSYSMPEDCPFTPCELITELLSRLHQHLVAHIDKFDKVDLMSPDVDVHYCLSVPAGWSPEAKNIMKQAAEAANFKKPVMLVDALTRVEANTSTSDTSNQSDCTSRRSSVADLGTTSRVGSSASSLRDEFSSGISLGYNGALEASAISIVHEQEAAALSACFDPWGTWDFGARPGDVWLIVDAGGGTVDIAMHAVQAGEQPGESQLSELLQSACLPYGSTVLDNMAEALLIKPMVASDAAYQRWKSDYPGCFQRQMKKWHDCKLEFDGDNELTLSLVESFLECLPAASPYRRQVIRNLDTASMKRVFEPVVSQITSQVKSMVSQQRSTDGRVGADVLLLCGGFGANDYLKSQLEKHCGDYIGEVVRPTEPLQAVLLGNTIQVLRPRSITARCSRVTYGLSCCRRVTPECHAVGEVITTSNGSELCVAHFKPLVQVGQVVQLDQRTEPWMAQVVPGSDVVRLEVFATEMETGVHVTEEHMTKVGEVEFEVTRKSIGRSMKNMLGLQDAADSARLLEISFLFGAAEIIVEAKKVGSKKAVRTAIKFASEPARKPVSLPQL